MFPLWLSLLRLSQVLQAEMLAQQLLNFDISIIKPFLPCRVERGAGERHCFFSCDGEEGLGSCSCSFFCLLLFVNQRMLVGLSHTRCCMAIMLMNPSLSRLWSEIFLWLTFNAYTCINVVRTWYYLNFNSKIALNFIQDMCNLI